MKRCSVCGSVSPDDEVTCGVCGGDLADSLLETENEVELEQTIDVQREQGEERKVIRRIERRRIAVRVSGFVLGLLGIIGGIVLIGQFNSPYGVLVIFAGMGLLYLAIGLHYLPKPIFKAPP